MGKHDEVLYEFFSDDDRFADFFNGAVFHGETVMRAELLEEASERCSVERVEEKSVATEQLSGKGAGAASGNKRKKSSGKQIGHSKYRDIKKRATNGMDFAIMAIENQADIDYTMPWRIMQYDQLEYGRQLRRIRNRKAQECLKRGKKVNRWTTKITHEDKLLPVYTVCFYHGTDKWNGPTSLADMMDFGENNVALKKLFHDYRMTLVSVDDLNDLSVFKTDLKLLLQALKLREDEEAMDDLFEQEEFRCVAEDTARAIAVMTDHTEILEYLEDYEDEGGVDMCKAVEGMRRKYTNRGIEIGIKEGRESGIKEGIKEGIGALITTCQELDVSYEKVVVKLREKFDLSSEDAQNYMNLYWINR